MYRGPAPVRLRTMCPDGPRPCTFSGAPGAHCGPVREGPPHATSWHRPTRTRQRSTTAPTAMPAPGPARMGDALVSSRRPTSGVLLPGAANAAPHRSLAETTADQELREVRLGRRHATLLDDHPFFSDMRRHTDTRRPKDGVESGLLETSRRLIRSIVAQSACADVDDGRRVRAARATPRPA